MGAELPGDGIPPTSPSGSTSTAVPAAACRCEAAAVSAAFRAHQLTWTTPGAALQFLAYQDPPERPVEPCLVRRTGATPARGPRPASGMARPAAGNGVGCQSREQGRPGRRYGRLAKHTPQPQDAAVQLSLFD